MSIYCPLAEALGIQTTISILDIPEPPTSEKYRKEFHSQYGRPKTEETKRLISLSKLGKPRSQAAKDAISKGKKGKSRPPRSKEWQDKLAQSRSRKWIITFPDGHTENIINMEKFCREHNLSSSSLHGTSTGKMKTHKGYSAMKPTAQENNHEDTRGKRI